MLKEWVVINKYNINTDIKTMISKESGKAVVKTDIYKDPGVRNYLCFTV